VAEGFKCQRRHQPEVSQLLSSTLGPCCLLFNVDKGERGPSAASHQADALRREGVEIREDAMGQYTIDLAKYGWFPDVLPSESGLVESSDEEDEEVAAYHT
jgi:hypothetical protein